MLLSKEESLKVEAAIKEAEQKTNGEIVVHVSQQSDTYFYTPYIVSLLLGGSVLLLTTFYSFYFQEEIGFVIEAFILAVFIIAFGITYLFPKLRLLFIPYQRIEQVVFTKAEQLFLEREVFNTKDRTGLLIFISELEHRVQVLGDVGINKVISQDQWDNIVDEIIKGIKNKNASDGIIKGISMAADLLVTSDFNIKPDDENELSNTVSFD